MRVMRVSTQVSRERACSEEVARENAEGECFRGPPRGPADRAGGRNPGRPVRGHEVNGKGDESLARLFHVPDRGQRLPCLKLIIYDIGENGHE